MSISDMPSLVPTIARRGLAEESADLLREAILAGRVAPGAPLREVELAASLGVSRGSVREGLSLLAREGLVRSAWHRGATVVDVTAQDVEEVYRLRAALDRLAATTAQQSATEEQLRELDRLVARMAAAVEGGVDGPGLLVLDLQFHDAVYAAAGNRRLTVAWRAVRSQVHLLQSRRVAASHQHYRDRVVDEHRDLTGLLRSDDRDALAAAAEEHVDAARRSLLIHLR